MLLHEFLAAADTIVKTGGGRTNLIDHGSGLNPVLAQLSLGLHLRELHIGGNSLTNDHLTMLCSAIALNEQVRLVCMTLENSLISDLAPLIELLTPAAAAAAAAAASHGGGSRLSTALPTRASARSGAGSVAAARASAPLAYLRRLDVSRNKITSASLRAFADALPAATSLRRVNLLQQKSFTSMADARYVIGLAETCMAASQAALAAAAARGETRGVLIEELPVAGALKPVHWLCAGVPQYRDLHAAGAISLVGKELERTRTSPNEEEAVDGEEEAGTDRTVEGAAAEGAVADGTAADGTAAEGAADDAAWRRATRATRWRISFKDAKPSLQDADALLLGLSMRSTGAAHRLVALDLSGNAIKDEGIKALCEAFVHADAKMLRKLRLSGLSIGESAITSLAAAFGSMALVELHLGYTYVGATGPMEAWAAGVDALGQLETLGLQRCNMLLGGAEVLAAALPRLPKLRHLHLDSNSLGSDTAQALLRAGTSVHTLSLQDCAISEGGPMAAALDAGAAPELNTLALGANAFRETATLLAAAALRPGLQLVNMQEAAKVVQRKGVVVP